MHAVLTAIVLWIALIITFIAGPGDRSVAGPLKGADFIYFYTVGSLAKTHHTSALYDFDALHAEQIALVPESAAEFYPPVYPPNVALVFAPFASLPFRSAMFLWNLITIVAFAFIVASAWRPVAVDLPDRRFVVAAAAAFPPFWNLVLHGQATILILAAFWVGWIALERQKRFWAGMAFGLLLIKPQFAIPLAVIVLFCGEWAMLAGAVTSIGIQLGTVALLLGGSVLKAYAAFVPLMLRHADLLEPKPAQSHSLRALTRLAPDSIGLLIWVGLSAVVLFHVVKVWKTDSPVRVRLGVAILASLLVNPHVIVYDATVLALPLIWLGAYVQQRRPAIDSPRFWICVYWLYVTLLAPTAAVVSVQVSVLLMMWVLWLVARSVTREHIEQTRLESLPDS